MWRVYESEEVTHTGLPHEISPVESKCPLILKALGPLASLICTEQELAAMMPQA